MKKTKLAKGVGEELRAGLKRIEERSKTLGGVFSIEDRARERATALERELIEEEIAQHDRGFEGNTRKCPKCGRTSQQYKGDYPRTVEFRCGEVTINRAYYVCTHCKHSSYPLDEKLGLVPGREQGNLREIVTLLAIVIPYNQAPQVCRSILGAERQATSMRRLALKEAVKLESSDNKIRRRLRTTKEDTVYIQIDGHMCPTREERTGPEDQGYREAKAVLAYRSADVVDITAKRKEIKEKILKAKITDIAGFKPVLRNAYSKANAAIAKRVVFLADGAKWIWSLADELDPNAVQILDYAHAKQYLYEYAKIRFTAELDRVQPWVKEQESRLFDDQVISIISEMRQYADLNERIDQIANYFESNAHRMMYGSFRARGLNIGSGAIESAGKQLSVARVKGAGMRWNIVDLNPILALRAAFLDSTWQAFWNNQKKLAA